MRLCVILESPEFYSCDALGPVLLKAWKSVIQVSSGQHSSIDRGASFHLSWEPRPYLVVQTEGIPDINDISV
jgi:hypothetical protein